jgi:transcriptional regulator with XRE-family HTH domain
MTEAEERSHLEPLSSGRRRPPRPPVRVAGAMADGLSDDDGSPRGGNWPMSPEHLRQIEKGITRPTLKALRKIAAALERSLADGNAHPGDEGPSQ